MEQLILISKCSLLSAEFVLLLLLLLPLLILNLEENQRREIVYFLPNNCSGHALNTYLNTLLVGL